jgi:hypothetical protein
MTNYIRIKLAEIQNSSNRIDMGIDDAIFKLSKVQFKGLQPSMQIMVMSPSPRPVDRDQGRSMYEADKKVMASVDKMLGLLSST